MLCLADPEEPLSEEFYPDYTDDLGDDLPSAMPHPFITRITHCKYLELLLCNNVADGIHGRLLLFEPFTLLQPYPCSPCC
jgi:hypothetical protein